MAMVLALIGFFDRLGTFSLCRAEDLRNKRNRWLHEFRKAAPFQGLSSAKSCPAFAVDGGVVVSIFVGCKVFLEF